MSVVAAGTSPCWEISHHTNGDREWWPHYATSDEAQKALVEDLREAIDDMGRGESLDEYSSALASSKVIQLKQGCVHLICDGCGEALGLEGDLVDATQASHLEPNLVEEYSTEWNSIEGERHYCPDCPVPEDVAQQIAAAQARRPGPNDVPFDGLREWVRDGFREEAAR